MITARYYQDQAEQSIYEYYGSGKTGNPVIAMPTGTGKSIVIAKFIHGVLQRWPYQRIMCLTHVKELIEQNAKKMLQAWPEAPVGIYSAGLKQRDTAHPIIFGGVQSVVKNINAFGRRDLLIVDEAHLISGKDGSSYGKVIAALKVLNPQLKVIGLSATPYRHGAGLISDGPIFTDICFDLTSLNAFNKLIDEGYICSLIPKRTGVQLNVADIDIQNGDFVQNQLQAAVDKDAITHAACKEIIEQGHDRRSWLIFASGVEHSNHIAATLQSFGVTARSVHSKVSNEEREEILTGFKSGEIRCVVNNNVLTTGFDHPAMDLIAMLRPTMSTALWVQMLGRGTRPSPDTMKENCLVLDFAGNTKRLGPINDPVIPKQRGAKGEGVAPIKICDNCQTYNHARATVCCCCGAAFESAPKIVRHASFEELIKRNVQEPPKVDVYDVQRVIYNRFQKNGSPPMIKVSYFCGLQMFNEFVCFEHGGFATKKAHDWWKQRVPPNVPPPPTVDLALGYVKNLRVPRQLRIWTNKRHPEVLSTIF